ncbi:MAG: hypothetical protein Q4B70_00860 [Lachnospiraceae bacterium]|nr:hypothetical protein [Lachnospiraceae bacterium]
MKRLCRLPSPPRSTLNEASLGHKLVTPHVVHIDLFCNGRGQQAAQ